MNNQKKNLAVISLLVLALGAIVAIPMPEEEKMKDNFSNYSKNSTVEAMFEENNQTIAKLTLEKADTTEERKKGLMYRKELENGTGMLFIWNKSENRSFWMKNTYIPLDMIFVTAEKTVRAIKEADPQPNISDEELKVYTSEGPAKYVIETNQNFSERKGIEKGTKISFK